MNKSLLTKLNFAVWIEVWIEIAQPVIFLYVQNNTVTRFKYKNYGTLQIEKKQKTEEVKKEIKW